MNSIWIARDKNGQKQHFVMVRHCKDCPAPIPETIFPICKSLDGVGREACVVNILPTEIIGKFIINKQLIKNIRWANLNLIKK